MNNDVECPYCGVWQEICHDDGQGYEEDAIHEQRCSDCDKAFVFNTFITFSYEASKADCLNGAPHPWTPMSCTKHWPEARECLVCGEEERGAYREEIQ